MQISSPAPHAPIAPVEDAQVRLDVERARHWVSVGAQPSETVRSIFRKLGVYEGQEEPKPRSRAGRAKETQTGARRAALKADRAQKKEARRNERIAAKNGLQRGQVEALAGQKAIERTAPGSYVYRGGNWARK